MDDSVKLWISSLVATSVVVLIAFIANRRSAAAVEAARQQAADDEAAAAELAAKEAAAAAHEKARHPAPKMSAGAGKRKTPAVTVEGPLLLSTLKGHTDTVTSVAFAPDCHTLATSSADRTVRLWQCASLCEREPTYRRFNVELDHATASCFSPDSKYLLLALEQSLNIQIVRIGKKELAVHREITSQHKSGPMMDIAIASNGSFLCTLGADQHVNVFSVQGALLTRLDLTKAMGVSRLGVSPCSQFIGVAAYATDVAVFKVRSDTSGAFLDATRFTSLSGHRRGVHDVAFTSDERAVTASKDGTVRVFSLDVRPKYDEQPQVLLSIDKAVPESSGGGGSASSHVCVSGDGLVVAVSADADIVVYDVRTGVEMDRMREAGPVSGLVFSPDSMWLASAHGRRAHVWRNDASLRLRIADLTAKISTATKDPARQQRLKSLIDDLQKQRHH